MPQRRRYYSEDDIEHGVTPSHFKRLGRERQKEYIRYWFHRNFEDPANETPRDDGEYIYIWGGPYDAREQLYDEFGSLVSEQVIEEVAVEVEGIAVDWAPGPDHPDHERAAEEWRARKESDDQPSSELKDLHAIIDRLSRGLMPSYGDAYELERRHKILDSLQKLKNALRALTPPHGGIGHNRPPPDENCLPGSVVDDVRSAGEVISTELAKPEPDALQVAKATSRLQTALAWFGKKANIAVDSFAKGLGGTAGKLTGASLVAMVGASLYPPLGNLLADVVKHLLQWLSHVTLPF
jgi:hypothetical protein